jgi:hypothetical protein
LLWVKVLSLLEDLKIANFVQTIPFLEGFDKEEHEQKYKLWELDHLRERGALMIYGP